MSDSSFFHHYVPPSKRPKPPTPPPEPKETNPWLISAPTPTPNPDGAIASPDPAPLQAQENNPWLISAPTPNLAREPAAPATPVAPVAPDASDASAAAVPEPIPAPPQFVPGLVYAAFPAIPVNNTQPHPQGQLYYSGAPVQVPNQQPFWLRNAARNAVTFAPVQVGIANQHAQAPPVAAPAPAAIPQVSGPLDTPTKYYCRELNGGYTLRTREQIATMTGEWALSSVGFPYFMRTW